MDLAFDGEEGWKRLKMVLEERGLWRDGMKLKCREKWTDSEGKEHVRKSCVVGVEDCCARRMMESQPDFSRATGMLEELTKRGHLVLFYPKFHCELNWIEFYRGIVNRGQERPAITHGRA